MRRTFFSVLVAAMLCVPPLRAQQVSISSSGAGSVVENALPVDAIVLTYSSTSKQFATVRVPSNGRAPLALDGATLVSVEPVAVQVGRREMFRACGVANPAPLDRAALLKELKDIDFLASPAAQEQIELASSIARLDLEQKADERQTYRNDPLRLELQRQAERYMLPGDRALNRMREHMSDVGSDITARALAWSDVEQERLRIIHDEYQSLQPLVEQARLAVQIREQELTSYRDAVAAWQSYSSAVVKALDASVTTADTSAVPPGRLAKSCDGPSQAMDMIELDGPDRAGLSVLIAEVSFDKGGKQLTHFRRLSKTSRWAGRIDWPLDATSATIRARWPGSTRWSSMTGTIQAQRKSMTADVADARRAAAEIEKKMKDSNFRSKGGDTIKTIPVF